MLRHLVKLVWNRKRANFLIIVEIFFSFLVVFVVATLGLSMWENLQAPLGFSYEDVMAVTVDTQAPEDRADAAQMATFEKVLTEARALPPVLSAAASMVLPYSAGGWTSVGTFGGRRIESDLDLVSLDYERTLGLRLIAGRFFAAGDEALDWQPVVINAAMASEVYGDREAVGRVFGDPSTGGSEPELRVVGVVEAFRKDGELSKAGNFSFRLLRASDRTPRHLLLKLRPGTPAQFEEQLTRRLQAVAPAWSFELQPLSRLRESNFRLRLTPLWVGGVVAFFLLVMVGLGLIGVLWQNLLRRAREMGLRRAVGASRADLHRQVLGEQLILTSFGVLFGILLVVQLPLLDLAFFIGPKAFAGGILLAAAVIFLLAALCALHPSRMVSRIHPAEALRYE